MKCSALMAAGLILTAATARAITETPLPTWNGTERADLESTGWLPGASLLAADPLPDEPEEAAEPLSVELPSPEEIADDSKLINEVAEQYLAEYFEGRPEVFLIDPQNLLGSTDYRDRLAFLNYHASDSTIDLYVYVIGGDQEFPSEVRQEEMIERCFSGGRPAVIVYYYLGAPQRSEVYLSPSLTDGISAPEQNRALESSILQAFEKTIPAEQLERFLVQISIRIYWMERKLSGESTTSDEGQGASAAPVVPALKPAPTMKFQWVRDQLHRLALPVAVLLGTFLTASAFSFWLRLRRRYRFPDFEVEPRLGGPHAAGVGAVISFASATLPPASQRDQVPDYLRRA